MKARLDREIRHALLISKAVQIANRHGLHAVTAESVSMAAGCSVSHVRKHFRSRGMILRAVASDDRLNAKGRNDAQELGLL